MITACMMHLTRPGNPRIPTRNLTRPMGLRPIGTEHGDYWPIGTECGVYIRGLALRLQAAPGWS